MSYLLYNTALTLAAPALALHLRLREDRRALLARFDPPLPVLNAHPIWVQACSVGEVNTARPILEALSKRFEGVPLLLTVSTQTGYELAQRTCPGCRVTWFPFDTRRAVRRFLARARPRALVLVETEIWPNVIRETRRAGIPIAVVNGRISDKHFARYSRFQRLLRPVFAQLNAAGVQEDRYAQRMAALGVPSDAVRVTGSTKFDGVLTHVDAHTRARLRRENGFAPNEPILIFGSTRPGDERRAAACWRGLREAMPRLRLVVAPRHLDRLDEAMAAFNEPIIRRSEVRAGRVPADERVFFLDTVGELVQFYSVADVAVIGGSFNPEVQGHNPLEPAALGVATVFGPHMQNFAEPARALVAGHGARQVREESQLESVLLDLLRDPIERRSIGTRGRKVVLENRGAIDRNLDMIAGMLERVDRAPESIA